MQNSSLAQTYLAFLVVFVSLELFLVRLNEGFLITINVITFCLPLFTLFTNEIQFYQIHYNHELRGPFQFLVCNLNNVRYKLSQIDRCEYEAISFDANDKHGAVKALRDFTSDETAFRETLEALAASVVKSAETPEL